MAYTDFIAAIDISTSRLTGILGQKQEMASAVTVSVIACETVEAGNCIRRGRIINVYDAAQKIKTLISKLELKIPGNRIAKVYVGIGGQSVRSIEYTVSRSLEANSTVTDALMDELNKECRAFRPEGLEVLTVLPPVCLINGHQEANPVGTLCSCIEAKYPLIVARPSLRHSVKESIKAASHNNSLALAGIIISPLALAEAVLSEDEKEAGCALMDFGAGVSSLAVYKNKQLKNLCVIPLGGNLITKDIAKEFNLLDIKAETVKQDSGSAIIDENDTTSLYVETTDKRDTPITMKDFNGVVAARQQEIILNVLARLQETFSEKDSADFKSSLRAGLLITGGASCLKRIDEAAKEAFRVEVRRVTSLRKNCTVKAGSDANPDIASVALLLQGYENCAAAPAVAPPPVVVVKQPEPPKQEPPVQRQPEPPVQVNTGGPKPTGGSGKGTGRSGGKSKKEKVLEFFTGTLFGDDEEDEEQTEENNNE